MLKYLRSENNVITICLSTVPCLPPYYVTFDAPTRTTILVKWNPVPKHCRNGIILGYKVRYTRLKHNVTWPLKTLNFTVDELHCNLTDLDIHSNYTVEVSAFNSKGESNGTYDLIQTDLIGTYHIYTR